MRYNNTRIILFALLLFTGLSSSGQELTRNFYQTTDEYSIVREVAKNEWLVLNYHYPEHVFWLVTESGTTSTGLRILDYDLTISDFEIFDDTVFFCGNALSTAIFGYYDLASFPSSTIHWVQWTEHFPAAFEKLDIYRDNTTTHAVFTATEGENLNMIVDAMHTSSSHWSFNWASPYDDDYVFDDIAVTDSYIVAVSRYQPSGLYVCQPGKVWFIPRPSSGTIFPATATYQITPFDLFSKAVLEHCEGNFVTVTSTNINPINLGCAAYNGPSFFSAVNASLFSLWERVVDAKYNKDSREMDIVTKPYKYSSDSYVYHLTQSLHNTGGPVDCHQYSDEHLYSIDYLTHLPDCFIAVGHDAQTSILKVYRYKYSNHEDCAVQKTTTSYPINKSEFSKKGWYEHINEYPIKDIWVEATSDAINTECPTKNEQQ